MCPDGATAGNRTRALCVAGRNHTSRLRSHANHLHDTPDIILTPQTTINPSSPPEQHKHVEEQAHPPENSPNETIQTFQTLLHRGGSTTSTANLRHRQRTLNKPLNPKINPKTGKSGGGDGTPPSPHVRTQDIPKLPKNRDYPATWNKITNKPHTWITDLENI